MAVKIDKTSVVMIVLCVLYLILIGMVVQFETGFFRE